MAGGSGGIGNVLPNNAFDLMKHIRENENKRGGPQNSMRAQVQANRILKQELQRETLERKLMEVEDYTYTSEGRRRERAYEDRLHMESEDMLATHIEKAIRNSKKLDFRDKIRREAEERQKQEELDRQKKLDAAEKRRQAVVERIRKKKEEEEAAIRRAEEARLREIAEKERAIQLAEERLRSDRAQMEMEDELSVLAEQLYKEYLEKLQWKKDEEKRLAAWEEEQRKKDELDALRRKERLAEIEAKKAQLAELRKAQMINAGGNQSSLIEKEESRIKDVQQAREEAIKLGKQMRIQNKAKYVSKKRKEEPPPPSSVDNIDNMSQPATQTTRRNSLRKSQDPLKIPQIPSLNGMGGDTLVEVNPDIVKKIDSITTETELYQFQKELMAEKRALRIEIMSTNESAPSSTLLNRQNVDNGPPPPMAETTKENSDKVSEIQNRVNEIAAIERCIQNKMDLLVSAKDKHKEATTDSNQIQPLESIENEILGGKEMKRPEERERKSLIKSTEDTPSTSALSTVSGAGSAGAGAGTGAQRRRSITEKDPQFYSNIERCLQETNEIVVKYGIFDLLTNTGSGPAPPSGGSGDKEITPRAPNSDYVAIIQRSIMLKMQMTEYLSKIQADEDIIGYREKIQNSIQKISHFIEKHQQLTPQKQPLVKQNSLTPEVLKRINSFTSLDAPHSPPKSRPPKKLNSDEMKDGKNDSEHTASIISQEKFERDLTESTSAIGKKFLNLVKHDAKKETSSQSTVQTIGGSISPRGTQEILSPRRKPGIAEINEKSSRHEVSLADEPYVVSPRTRLSPRFRPLDEATSPRVKTNNGQGQLPESQQKNMKSSESNPSQVTATSSSSTTARASTTTSSSSTTSTTTSNKPRQKPLLHPTTVSAPVLISTQAKKVAGHVAIEFTDLEDSKSNPPSRKNSIEERVLKSCDSTSSMLSTGVSDNVDNNWWGGNGGSGNSSLDRGDSQKNFQKKTSSTQVLSKTSPRTVDNDRNFNDDDDDDDWWNQAGKVDEQNDYQSQQDEEGYGYGDGYGYGQESEQQEFDYNSIPGWTECLHTTMATAAHHAAFYGYTQVLECLSYYFDLFQLDKNGRTPLFYAALRNNLDCVLLLVSIDPQWIEVGDYRGDTAIHAAAISNGDEVLSFLITCEINPSIANYEGLTPIHLCKSPTALLALYNANATMYCVDNNSRMPLWYRCKDGNKEAVDLLCRLMPINYIIWQDVEGNTPLHIACMNGHEEIVEILCQWYTQFSDYYILNKKNYSIVHLAKTSTILKKLYEYGIDLWIPDSKQRYPLFINAFQGKVDCVSLLIDIAIYRNQLHIISSKDFQGDTALHAACLTGNIQCISLLLYYIRDTYNNQGFLAYQLAEKAGYHDIAKYVYQIEQRKLLNETSYDIYQCTFEELATVILYYGTRWCKLYDINNDELYYYDRVLQLSQWSRPHDYDEMKNDEILNDKIRNILKTFYLLYNPEKLGNINEIITTFKNKHQELFLQLAERYHVEDLSIFNMD